MYEAGKVTLRRDFVEDNQVGVMVVGNNVRVKRSTFHRHTSDAIILLGDSNLVTAADVDGASVSGCFITGDHNVMRGGFFTNAPIGLWFLGGIGNAFYGITWGTIPLETRGVYGGLRDFRDDAAPFLTALHRHAQLRRRQRVLDRPLRPRDGRVQPRRDGLRRRERRARPTTCDPLVGCQFTPPWRRDV